MATTAFMVSSRHHNDDDDGGGGNNVDASIRTNNDQSPLPSLPTSLKSDNGVPLVRIIGKGDIDVNIEEETFFDLIVGTGFVSEQAEVEEVGGDPSFLADYDDDDEKWDE